MIPSEPVTASEFFEDVVPALFADLDLDEHAEQVDLLLGVVLEGEGGGAWSLHFVEGELGISAGRSEACAVTIVLTVEDWRAPLWEGRPGLIADALNEASEAGPGGLDAASLVGVSNPAAFDELASLRGRIDVIFSGTTANTDSVPSDLPWTMSIVLGDGPIPDSAAAELRLDGDQAEAIRHGEVHPLEALITGRLRFEGDIGLVLRLQAIALAASLPAPPSR